MIRADVCRLCMNKKDLRDSHLIPRAIYALVRDQTGTFENPNPVIVSADGTLQTSAQFHDYLLCGDCEDLFSKSGETWVVGHCARSAKDFPLRELLLGAQPIRVDSEFCVYAGNKVPGLEMDKLIYFALSVFWRAAVHTWKFRQVNYSLDLGPYEEDFRLYLLGLQGFPSHTAMTIGVSARTLPFQVATVPFGGRDETTHHYRLAIPGIVFDLRVGRMMPKDFYRVCSMRSNEQFISMTKTADEDVFNDLLSAYTTSHPSRRLAEQFPARRSGKSG